jgi:putative ABC transport system substrate-binding protein
MRLSRRRFVVGAGAAGLGLALLPSCQNPSSPAREPARLYRIGWLHGGIPAVAAGPMEILRQRLGVFGYVEGQNLVIEYRWGQGSDDPMPELAAELVRLPVDLIVVPSITVARAARQATSTIPIVMVGIGDPVAGGLAASYARPGGNVTGVLDMGRQLSGKRLELLKEVVPSATRVLVLWDPSTTPFPSEREEREAQALGVQLQTLAIRTGDDVDRAFEAETRAHASALLAAAGPALALHRGRIIDLAAQHQLPAIYFNRVFVDEGGLMAYVANLADLWQRAAVHIDKILRGTKPADIPVEQPMRFDFLVNLKTARELGITFPPEIQLQITEAVE